MDGIIEAESVDYSDVESSIDSDPENYNPVIKYNYREKMINRLKYFQKHFPSLGLKVQYMFHHLIDFYCFEKYINYNYFVKRICKYYRIKNKIKCKKDYKEKWDKFLKYFESLENEKLLINNHIVEKGPTLLHFDYPEDIWRNRREQSNTAPLNLMGSLAVTP